MEHKQHDTYTCIYIIMANCKIEIELYAKARFVWRAYARLLFDAPQCSILPSLMPKYYFNACFAGACHSTGYQISIENPFILTFAPIHPIHCVPPFNFRMSFFDAMHFHMNHFMWPTDFILALNFSKGETKKRWS